VLLCYFCLLFHKMCTHVIFKSWLCWFNIFFALAGDLGLDLSFLELRIRHSGCRIYLLDLVGDNGYDIVM